MLLGSRGLVILYYWLLLSGLRLSRLLLLRGRLLGLLSLVSILGTMGANSTTSTS